jgi:hypothetical protein
MSNDETSSATERPWFSPSWPRTRRCISRFTSNASSQILERWLERKGSEYASIHTDYPSETQTLRKYAAHEWNPHRFQILAAIRQESVSYARTPWRDLGLGNESAQHAIPIGCEDVEVEMGARIGS